MEMMIFAVHDGFYEYAKQHPKILACIAQVDAVQQKHILLNMDERVLCERAIQYFDCEDIYLKEHVLYFKNTLRSTLHSIRIDTCCIHVQDHEQNPFFPFLKRIFRSIVSINAKEVVETYEKCCKNAQNIVK